MAPELSPEADTPPPSDGSYSQVSGAGAKPGSQAGAGAGAARGGEGGERQGGAWLLSNLLPSINFDIRWRGGR